MKRLITSVVAALALVVPSVASADVVRSGNVITEVPATANGITTIDGYVFAGMAYYDASPAVDSAVEFWWALEADPNYVSLPPVTSISTTAPVSGTVEPEATATPEATPEPARSSWGRHARRSSWG